MKYIHHILIFLSFSIIGQNPIETELIKETSLKADNFISANNFGDYYYVFDNVLFKHTEKTKGIDVGYNNFQLGDITSVNTFNPLKINLFYKDFNTVIILDNRLSEIFKLDFNTISPYKNITHASTGFDNTIWIFNQNTLQLELFDYKTSTTRQTTMPISSPVLDIKSNYNNCWLLTENYIYVYNYFGSLIKKIKNKGYTSLAISNENLILKKENALYYLKSDTEKAIPINTSNLLINEFFVTNETLYIYSNETLHEYQIKIN
jgi:hypothetical protein